ncbi:2626_t:CDS:2, partial [Ambispora leptoticha]
IGPKLLKQLVISESNKDIPGNYQNTDITWKVPKGTIEINR